MPKFETLIIMTDKPLDIIYGKNTELLRRLKDFNLWETIAEELSENNEKPETIEELVKIVNNTEKFYYTYTLHHFIEQNYKP